MITSASWSCREREFPGGEALKATAYTPVWRLQGGSVPRTRFAFGGRSQLVVNEPPSCDSKAN